MYFGNDIFMDCQIVNIENYINLGQECTILTESIDLDEGYGGKLRPVYIVLLYANSLFDKVAEKFVKDQQYWHAALSFGPNLNPCYSYAINYTQRERTHVNKIKGGIAFENISDWKKNIPNGKLQVSVILLPPDKFKKVKNNVDYFIMNKERTNYSIKTLFDSLHNKAKADTLSLSQVCSTFVATILKFSDIDLNNGKAANLIKPDDLRVGTTNTKKHFKIFEGDLNLYDPQIAALRTEKLANNLNKDYFKK